MNYEFKRLGSFAIVFGILLYLGLGTLTKEVVATKDVTMLEELTVTEEVVATKAVTTVKEASTEEVVATKAVTTVKEASTEEVTFSEDITNNSTLEEVEDEYGAPKEYKRVVKVIATAYCLCKKCCGKSENDPYYGVTASGLRIIPNTGMKVVAIDPKKFSLGDEVYVESLDGSEDYGKAIAADTGGAIKGNHIDLYMDSHQQALEWGKRYVNLYIL